MREERTCTPTTTFIRDLQKHNDDSFQAGGQPTWHDEFLSLDMVALVIIVRFFSAKTNCEAMFPSLLSKRKSLPSPTTKVRSTRFLLRSTPGCCTDQESLIPAHTSMERHFIGCCQSTKSSNAGTRGDGTSKFASRRPSLLSTRQGLFSSRLKRQKGPVHSPSHGVRGNS